MPNGDGVTARQVHAVIAAGVENPRLIEVWQRQPELLRQVGVDPDSLDFTALRKFAGLSTKVRHNGLRQYLPLSFRLMSVTTIEIEVFASYSVHCSLIGRTLAATPLRRADDLIDFLGQWLDLADRNQRVLWDIIRHEYALSVLATRALPPMHAWTHVSLLSPDATSIPSICGQLLLRELSCDPREVSEVLRQRTPPLETITLKQSYIGYWASDASAEVNVLYLDEYSQCILERVDGELSAAQLCEHILGSQELTAQFVSALAQLAGMGLLRFRAPVAQSVQ